MLIGIIVNTIDIIGNNKPRMNTKISRRILARKIHNLMKTTNVLNDFQTFSY